MRIQSIASRAATNYGLLVMLVLTCSKPHSSDLKAKCFEVEEQIFEVDGISETKFE